MSNNENNEPKIDKSPDLEPKTDTDQVLAPKTDTKDSLLKKTETQLHDIYTQINRLLLWKSSLKVKINDKCPRKEIVGRIGYVSDLFPDGFTVWCKKDEHTEEDFFRLPAEFLDIVEWDQKHFDEVLVQLKIST